MASLRKQMCAKGLLLDGHAPIANKNLRENSTS